MKINSLYTHVKTNAMWNHFHLASKNAPGQESVNKAIDHLCDCMDHPTLGLLMRQGFKNNVKKGTYKKNLNFIEELSDDYNTAKKSFDECYNALYPKTGTARKFLINRNCVVLGKVKPVKKTFDRFIFKVASGVAKILNPVKTTIQRDIFHNCG